MGWLADAGAVDLSVFAQYGIVGIIAVGGILFAKGAYGRERDRGDRLEEENRRLNTVIQDRIIPALMAASRAAEESSALLRSIAEERNRRITALERQGREDN